MGSATCCARSISRQSNCILHGSHSFIKIHSIITVFFFLCLSWLVTANWIFHIDSTVLFRGILFHRIWRYRIILSRGGARIQIWLVWLLWLRTVNCKLQLCFLLWWSVINWQIIILDPILTDIHILSCINRKILSRSTLGKFSIHCSHILQWSCISRIHGILWI